MCPGLSTLAGTWWQVLQAMGAEMKVLPNRCALWAPTPRAEGLVLPETYRGGAADCALPWQEVQVAVPSAATWSEWHWLHETTALPPERSVPWHCWQMAKFQLAPFTTLAWNSSSLGLRTPLSCTPERKSASRPSTTHARTVPYALDTGAWTASARAGSITLKSSELGSPATATGAPVGPSASRYEVVRYPAAAWGPEWQELQSAAKSGAMSSCQLTGCPRSPCSGRAFEHEAVASAAAMSPWSARMGALGRPVEVHEADRRDPIRPVADQALLERLGGQAAAR